MREESGFLPCNLWEGLRGGSSWSSCWSIAVGVREQDWAEAVPVQVQPAAVLPSPLACEMPMNPASVVAFLHRYESPASEGITMR